MEISSKYHQSGYIVLRQVLRKEFLDSVEEAVFKPFIIMAKSLFGETISSNASMQERHELMLKIKNKNPDYYINAMKVSQHDPSLHAVASCPEIISIIKKLGLSYPVVSLKPFPILVSSALAIEGGYNLRPAHQEWPVMQGSHNGVVAWFPLHDLSDSHSSLEVYPKSHLKGVLPYEVSRCGSRVACDSIGDPIQLEVKRGDLIIFSSFMVHKSGEVADNLRASISIRFNDLEEQSFVSRGFKDNSSLAIKREPLDSLPHQFSK